MKELTQSEIEIIDLLCQGYSYSDVARKRVTTLSTAKTHITNIFRKLKIKKHVQLMALVLNGSLPGDIDAPNER